MAQHFNEDVSAERLSTVSDVVYPRPEPEYVGHGAEVPPDVRPPEHYPSPVSAETGRSNAAQQVSGFGNVTGRLGESQSHSGHEDGVDKGIQEEGDASKSKPVSSYTPETRSSPDGTQDAPQRQPKWLTVLMIIIGLTTFILFLSTVTFISPIKHSNQQWEETSHLELLQSDTILAYQGSIPVKLTSKVEDTNPSQYTVILNSVSCNELDVHESHPSRSNLSLSFSTEYPTTIPPGYPHYEFGSTFQYDASVISGPNTSELTLRIFSNTMDADYYIGHSTNKSAQKRAVFEHKFNSSRPTPVNFDPLVASYYIATFVASAETVVNISYNITKKYYSFTDYEQMYIESCQLNSTEEPCYFDRSNGTEVCVIAYYVKPSSRVKPRILLMVSNMKSEDEYTIPFHMTLFYVSLCIFVLSTFVFVGSFCYCCWRWKCCKSPKLAYHQVPMEDCGSNETET